MRVLALSFATPLGLLVGLSIIPVVLFFLLKRKRQSVVIGSTMLWAKALRDTLARSPFRRPSEWLSLLLLLAAISALALAAGGIRRGPSSGSERRVVVIVDTSASMATVEEGDDSRLDLARRGALAAIASGGEGDSFTIVAAGGRPRAIGRSREDPALLRSIVEDLAVEPGEGDLRSALELAAGELEGRGEESVLVFSDFGEDIEGGVDVRGASVSLVRCGSERPNAGFVHASVSGGDEAARLLVTVAANQVEDQVRTLTLLRGDELVDAREIEVPAGGVRSIVLDLVLGGDLSTEPYRLRLEPPDAFSLDDEAFIGIHRAPPPRVLHVGDEDAFIARLPVVFPGLELQRVSSGELEELTASAARPFDLAILTESAKAVLPLAPVELYIGCLPDGAGVTESGALVDPVVVDWDRKSPWLRDLGLENLLLIESLRLEVEATAAVLVRSSGGAQLVELEHSGGCMLIWASEMGRSNLALLPAFPMLIRNLLGERLGEIAGSIERTGDGLRLQAGLGLLAGTVDVTLEGPSGEEQNAELWAREELAWKGTLDPGLYYVKAIPEPGGETEAVSRWIGASLLSEAETKSVAREGKISFLEGGEVSTTSIESFETAAPVWHWLVALAIVALVFESWVWSRLK